MPRTQKRDWVPTLTTGRPRCAKVVFITLCVEVVRPLGFEFGLRLGIGYLRGGGEVVRVIRVRVRVRVRG